MSIRPAKTVSLLVLFAMLLVVSSGCATHHSFRAILLEKSADEKKNEFVPLMLTGNNPVYLHENGKFSIKIKELRPGWIHAGNSFQKPDATGEKKWKRSESQHIFGKELWLITHIHSLDNQDPLETKSKNFYHASNVKFDSESFGSIPLDSKESLVFVHNADSSYRVEFRVYEVDGFTLKQQIVKAVNDPGISGLITTGFNALKSTASSVVGTPLVDYAYKSINDVIKDQMLFETLILQAGGTLELQGSVNLLKSERLLADKEKGDLKKITSREYVLYDPIKSNKLDPSFTDRSTYEKAISELKKLRLDIKASDSEFATFLCFVVEEVVQPDLILKKGAKDLNITEEKHLLFLQAD